MRLAAARLWQEDSADATINSDNILESPREFGPPAPAGQPRPAARAIPGEKRSAVRPGPGQPRAPPCPCCREAAAAVPPHAPREVHVAAAGRHDALRAPRTAARAAFRDTHAWRVRRPARFRDQARYCPPFAESVEPVMKPASSEARKTTQRAISSGSPSRPTGISGRMRFSRTSCGTARTISVPI